MIIRIVKMTFQENRVEDFLELFNENKSKIRGFEGVEKLELYRDKKQGHVFFTYSIWGNENQLENYRRSELFQSVWSRSREMFSAKAEAWSVDKLVSL